MDDNAFNRYLLSLPGSWIDHVDRNWAGDLQLLLGRAADQFNEALVAFDLFKPLSAEDIRRDLQCSSLARDDLDRHRRFIYAKAFVCALDAARTYVGIIATASALPPATVTACEAFSTQFRYVRDMRNSLQHIEDRIRAKGPGKKILPGPIIDLGSLNERRFGVTIADGRHFEVEISEDFVVQFRSALSEVFWSLDWLGPGETSIQRRKPDA